MIKFKITPDRFAESCSIIEYLLTQQGNQRTVISIAHRFILGDDGEYLVKVNLDTDGDVIEYENDDAARVIMSKVTPKRLERLSDEFMEAARSIVNPQKGEDSNGPTSTDTKKPPPG